jgi:cytosine/adenosine deaminase-related metal-dependent hydrolase
MPLPMTLVNARLGARQVSSVRLSAGLIESLDAPPSGGDLVMDVAGDRVLPGLINAHDHLQLNNFPRIRYRDRHDDVGQWIADIDAHRATDRAIAGPAALGRDLRLLIGGLKNILSGVTTVAHHDPCYPSLRSEEFPCRVLADYGWAHSLGLNGDDAVRASCRATPADQPWFIHAGEGLSAAARAEFGQLERLGCIGRNTRLIHGVAFAAHEHALLAARGAGLIWCPSSNFHLFDATAECASGIIRGCVALGSDSRLSGAGDLLDELCVAHARCGVAPEDLEPLVTAVSARLLGFADRGRLVPGALADCVVLPRDVPLGVARRGDLRCVVLGGRMVWGVAAYADALMAPEHRVAATLDGRAIVVERRLAETLHRVAQYEDGLRLAPRGWAA